MSSRYRFSSSSSLSHIPFLPLTIFLSLHQITARVLQLDHPHIVAQNNLTVESVVQTALDHLNHSSDPAYSKSTLLQIALFAPPPSCPKILRHSSNISDFHEIILLFALADSRPFDPATYMIENKYPEQWGQWNYTNRPFPGASTLDHSLVLPPIHFKEKWRLVQQKMPVENADRLLKNAGFRGRYSSVELSFETAPWAPLAWVFRWVEIPGVRSNNDIVTVEVATGKLEFLRAKEVEAYESRYGELSLEGLGRGSGESCMIETS